MRKIFNEMAEFMSDKVNRVFISVWIIGITTGALLCYNIVELNAVKADIQASVKSAEKKVDFRYFNLTNSLQDIHKVKIETHHGRIER